MLEDVAVPCPGRRKLAELEAALSRYPHVTACLNRPANDKTIREANAALAPFELPEWLEELYRWHDGCEYPASYLFELPFNSLKGGLEYLAMMEGGVNGFGFYRYWTFPFLGVDKDMQLAVLDQPGTTPDPSILHFMMQDDPFLSFETPFEWVDSLLFKLSHIDEHSFGEDGRFDGYWQVLSDKGVSVAQPEQTSHHQYGSLSAGQWPQSYRERGGILGHLVSETDLPSWEERTLHHGERLPHDGPWNIYLGDLDMKFYRSEPPKLPTTIWMKPSHMAFGSRRNPNRESFEALLPKGVLTDHILRYCLDLDAVVWFEPATIADKRPVIARIAFPV